MKTSQSSLFILTAGIALILCAVIFFLPESADDPLLSTSEGAAKAGNPVVSTEPEPASPRLAPATKADSGTEASRSKAKEEPLTSISLAQAHLALQIFDDEGNPLEGALVQLAKAPDRGGYSYYGSIGERLIRNPELLLAQANTGADGTALIAGLAQHSEYEVLITANGKASVEVEFETEDLGKPIAIGPVPLGPSAAVEIEILEADGTPVAGMEVTVYADPIPERYSKDFPPY